MRHNNSLVTCTLSFKANIFPDQGHDSHSRTGLCEERGLEQVSGTMSNQQSAGSSSGSSFPPPPAPPLPPPRASNRMTNALSRIFPWGNTSRIPELQADDHSLNDDIRGNMYVLIYSSHVSISCTGLGNDRSWLSRHFDFDILIFSR